MGLSLLAVLLLLTCGRSSGFPDDLRPLAPGEELSRQIGPEERHGYRIALDEGDFLAVEVIQEGADVELLLRDPDGQEVVGADSPNGPRGPELLFATTAGEGEYVLEIRPWGQRGGDYRVSYKRRSPDPQDRLRARGSRFRYEAGEWLNRGAPDPALSARKHAVEAWTRTGERYLEVLTRIEMGRLHQQEGRYKAAIEQYRPTLQQVFDLRAEELTPVLLNFLGASLESLKEYSAAREELGQALVAAREFGLHRREGIILNDLGQVAWKERRPWVALNRYEQALAMFRKLEDRREEAQTLHNRALVFNWLGREREALDDLERALEWREELQDEAGVAETLLELGWVQMWLGQDERARARMEEAERRFRRLGNWRHVARALDRLGTFHLRQGRPEEARALYQRAIELFFLFDPAPFLAPLLNNLGRTYRVLGQEEMALALHTDALALFSRVREQSGMAHALLGRARIHRSRGQYPRAQKELHNALAKLEELRRELWSPGFRSDYMATVHEYFELHIDVLMDLEEAEPGAGWAARAFEAAEESRARTLLELVQELGASLGSKSLSEELLDRQSDVALTIRALEAEERRRVAQGAPVEEVEELQRRLRGRGRERARLQGEERRARETEPPQSRRLDEIRSALDPDTSLLVFALGDRRSFLWLLGPDGLVVHELPARKEIRAIVEPLVADLTRAEDLLFGLDPLLEKLELAGDSLLGPVRFSVRTKRLAVVPDGILHRLPFAALRLEDRYLNEDFEVVRLPSASVLLSLRERRQRRTPPPGLLALMADPVFRHDDERLPGTIGAAGGSSRLGDPPGVEALGRLPESGEEAEAIAHLLPVSCRWMARGFGASRTAITEEERLADFRLVHLATHAVLDDNVPEHSGLVLSRVDEHRNPLEGFVYAFEIAELELPADLVVLSACRTADGQPIRGEGLVGLSQSFFEAGASRLVASLWEVDDSATKELMVHFYKGLLEEKLPPTEALRRAQHLLLQSDLWNAPYYWAPFVLIGDWQELPSTLLSSPCLKE